ncbi:hypothetical protein [Natrinema sp. DC36]|uniref:hypothetical protein n=1 Tax=Natrinema sp. DC36 TaxID=2878680 RepID=UPI001CF0CB3D|nr:hypothetical protein [Natrinema sp. DC36]
MRDDRYDEQRYESRDSRSNTDTSFIEYDIDSLQVSQRRKNEYKRMLRWQEGEDPYDAYSSNRKSREQQNREEWKRRIVDTYTSHLDLTRYQKQRVKHLTLDVMHINSFGHFSIEQIVLGIINRVAREDDRWIEDEKGFQNLCIDVGFEEGEVAGQMKTLRSMVRERIPSDKKRQRWD